MRVFGRWPITTTTSSTSTSTSFKSEKSVGNTNKSLFITNLIGFVLSVYAYYVSVSKRAEPNYRAFCDLSAVMSCSRVLTSPYSTGFGVMRYFVDESSWLNATNSVVGMSYYLLSIALSFSNNSSICKVLLTISIISNLGSLYLAAVLIVLKDVCFVCISTYIVNALNYLFLSRKLRLLSTYTKAFD